MENKSSIIVLLKGIVEILDSANETSRKEFINALTSFISNYKTANDFSFAYNDETSNANTRLHSQKYTFEDKRKEFPNAYRSWLDSEDTLLCALYDYGVSTKLMSEVFGRNSNAIRSRLHKLKKIED